MLPNLQNFDEKLFEKGENKITRLIERKINISDWF